MKLLFGKPLKLMEKDGYKGGYVEYSTVMDEKPTPLEAVVTLYAEREYTYAASVNHKSDRWAVDIKHYDTIGDCLIIIKSALETYATEHEVLRIIRDKFVDLKALMLVSNVAEYNSYVELANSGSKLTKDEFDFLRNYFHGKIK